MLDGLGMAETTPGPLIMVTQFVASLVPGASRTAQSDCGGHAGRPVDHLGHLHALLPLDLLGAPFVEMLRANKALAAALGAVTAAVVGVILNLAVWFGLQVLFATLRPVHWLGATLDVPVLASANIPSIVLAAAAAIAVFRFKFGMVPVLLASSLTGVVYFLVIRGV